MRRRIAFAFVTAAVSVALAVTPGAPAFAAVSCTGSMTGDINASIRVPAGATCDLFKADVHGNAQVDPTGILLVNQSKVQGFVNANQPGRGSLSTIGLGIFSSTIGGSLTLSGPGTGATGTVVNAVCDSDIAGNVAVSNVRVNSLFSAGTGVATFAGGGGFGCGPPEANEVHGAVLFENNQGNVNLSGNSVDSPVRATGNTGGGTINDNKIAGSLLCSNNVPAFTATGNTTAGKNTC